MPVKYTQYKQTCQTLQQNAVQLNKSVTTKWSQLLGVVLLSSALIFLLLHLVTNESIAEEPTVSPQLSARQPNPIIPESIVASATKDDTATQVYLQSAQPLTITSIARTLRATPTSNSSPQFSPLPTPSVGQIATLSTTVELQNRVALSVALVAQSLFASLQQPLQSAAQHSLALTPPSSILPVTTTSGILPPLVIPTVGLVPPQTRLAESRPAQSADESVELLPAITLPGVPAELFPDEQLRTVQVPVLMYHYLSEVPIDADIYRRDLSVTPDLFAAHLDRIAAEGYTVIRLYDLAAYLLQGTPLPPKAVVITFDDGYRDNYENAFPLLHERNMTATFFVVMEFINRERPEYLTWPMVQEMAAAGMSFEAHGVDHTSLRGRTRPDLEFQALRSYETLQNAVGLRARFVSYPAGEYDEQTIAAFQDAGYWAGFTTVQGATHRSDDLFRLPRVRVRGTTSPDELARLLALEW